MRVWAGECQPSKGTSQCVDRSNMPTSQDIPQHTRHQHHAANAMLYGWLPRAGYNGFALPCAVQQQTPTTGCSEDQFRTSYVASHYMSSSKHPTAHGTP